MSLSTLAMFDNARRQSCPIISVATPDPAATINLLRSNIKNAIPTVQWDVVRGFTPLNDTGKALLTVHQAEPQKHTNPAQALTISSNFPPKAICFYHNMTGILAKNDTEALKAMQAIWNLRDIYASNFRTCVLLGTSAEVPEYIEGDVITIDEPLPTADVLQNIVNQAIGDAVAAKADFPVPDTDAIDKAVDALRGLAAFPATQAVALSISKLGLSINDLWDRKREKVKQCGGLEVFTGDETFDSIGGCDNVKQFLTRLMAGPDAPRVIVFVDEIEKAMAGASGDTSGVSQEMHGTLLSWMEDKKAQGTLFLGPPGAAKSAVAKACGNETGRLTIIFDMSGMKNALVGQSNQNLKRALKVIDGVGDGSAMVIATCNSVSALSPELLRRFKSGKFFFDLPNAAERARIWDIYLAKYNVKDADLDSINDEGWTGAEIKQCCEFAYRLRVSIAEASLLVIPVSVSSADKVRALRTSASGQYLSANKPGRYEFTETPEAVVTTTERPNPRRAVNLGE